VKEDAIRQ